jgi:hypothetical protein
MCSVHYSKVINHRQENKAKIKLKHQNLTSQFLPVCLPLKGHVFAISIEITNFWCLLTDY